MNELHKIWLKELYKREIEEENGTISNERIWENGCYEEYNPHTENIKNHEEYIEILKNLIESLDI